MKIREALAFGQTRLKSSNVTSAAIDARWLLAHVMETTPSALIVEMDRSLNSDQIEGFEAMINRRSMYQPVAQIIGEREFWGRRFQVTPETLDPRPETETLIERALTLNTPNRILDLGTGTGCIILTLLSEYPNAVGVGIDASKAALEVATSNAKRLQVSDRVEFAVSDWWKNIQGSFDLIVSNPPYISASEYQNLSKDVKDWEPKLALTPGGDGLESYRTIASGLGKFLAKDGTALFEFGSSQAEEVAKIFQDENWANFEIQRDLNEHQRVLVISN